MSNVPPPDLTQQELIALTFQLGWVAQKYGDLTHPDLAEFDERCEEWVQPLLAADQEALLETHSLLRRR